MVDFTLEPYLEFFILLSLIPIGFQSFVVYYTLKVRNFIGVKSFWLMMSLSISGLIYDCIITGSLANRVNVGEPLTFLGIFFGFIFPIQRSGCLLWLTRVMAKGLAYHRKEGYRNK